MAEYSEGQKDKKDEEASAPMTAKGRYNQLKSERDPFLTRARQSAVLTIPSAMPPEGSDGSTNLDTPFQSVGARGVTNLAAKLLLVMFPPGSAFFRLDVIPTLFDKLDDTAKSDITKALAKYEDQVRGRMEQMGCRTQLNETLEQLIISGNFLIQVLKDGGLKGHRLDRYVVKRDLEGTVSEMVIMESLSRATAPENIKAILANENVSETADGSPEKDKIDIYTWICRLPLGWKIHQEVCDTTIPGSTSTQPLDKCAWIPLRWSANSGEDYGRGFCERHLGDLESCDRLNRALLDFAAAASKLLPMVKPGGSTDIKKVARAKNLEVIKGDPKDVAFLQMEKFADFKVVLEQTNKVERRLEQAFLLISGSQRDAERVTAEEIRLLAQELEAALGGTYPVLAQELQRPLVVRYIHIMQKSGDLPALPDKSVSPQIVTGMAGLGRSSDLQKLDALLAGISQIFGPEAVAEYINVGEYAKRRSSALSVDTSNLIRSDEDVQKARAEAAQRELAGKLAPQAMKSVTESAAPTPQGVGQ